MNITFIKAFDIPDAWYQCLRKILESGYEYRVERGSYKGSLRKEFDFVITQITNPMHRPLIPDIPPGLGLPPPTSLEYVEQYLLEYLGTDSKKADEDYTYGQRLVNYMNLNINQIDEVIRIYNEEGKETNQATMAIECPTDIKLKDPPCLRLIDTRIRYGKLHWIVYFRSWDLWSGFPPNLAGLQLLKEYMVKQINDVEDGEIIACSKGLHLYEYAFEFARTRAGKARDQKT